jgi:hypothetical protein
MNRDTFRRGTRFSFAFGELERAQDPLGSHTFTPRYPQRVNELSTPGFSVQQQGEHRYFAGRSGVVTPSGRRVSLEGPEQDLAFACAMPVPMSTRGRKNGPAR